MSALHQADFGQIEMTGDSFRVHVYACNYWRRRISEACIGGESYTHGLSFPFCRNGFLIKESRFTT